MMKTRQDNNEIDRTIVVYAENEIELSRLIRPSAVLDEDQTGQQHDRSYKCSPLQNQN